MPIAPPKMLEPGFKDPDWKRVVTCSSLKAAYDENQEEGCGAVLEVRFEHLYSARRYGQTEVSYMCSCGNRISLGPENRFNFGKELPQKPFSEAKG